MAAALEMTLDDLTRFLAERADRLRRLDLSQPLRVILQLAKASVKENFAAGAAPDGTAWLPLKQPRQGRRHRGSSPLPLRDTGLLMASVAAAGPHHVEHLDADGFAFGTNLEYAAIQNFGGTVHQPERTRSKPWVFTAPDGAVIFTRKIKAHDVTIPARPFLSWSDKLIAQTVEVLGEALENEVLG